MQICRHSHYLCLDIFQKHHISVILCPTRSMWWYLHVPVFSSSIYYYFAALWMFLGVSLWPPANNNAQGVRSDYRLKNVATRLHPFLLCSVCHEFIKTSVTIWRALRQGCAGVWSCLYVQLNNQKITFVSLICSFLSNTAATLHSLPSSRDNCCSLKPGRGTQPWMLLSLQKWKIIWVSAPTFHGFFLGPCYLPSIRFHKNRATTFSIILLTNR